jgi:tRNA (cytidine/uridine-2'-O-)-methyltransferase
MTDFKLNIVLHRPEIPQNTGSIGRLCVNLGATLHLIKPLGFSLDEKQVKRAGLDYWEHLDLHVHDDWDAFLEAESPQNFIFASTKGKRNYFDWTFTNGAFIVFGSESSGLPKDFYERYADSLYCIPMPGKGFRSLNLSNSAAVIAYDVYRQFLTG